MMKETRTLTQIENEEYIQRCKHTNTVLVATHTFTNDTHIPLPSLFANKYTLWCYVRHGYAQNILNVCILNTSSARIDIKK